jgi:hypothetical protein
MKSKEHHHPAAEQSSHRTRLSAPVLCLIFDRSNPLCQEDPIP